MTKVRGAMLMALVAVGAGLLSGLYADLPWFRAAAGSDTGTFTWHAPGDITFKVTAAGLSSIKVKDRELARGSWQTINADSLFALGSGKVIVGDILEKVLTVRSKNEARVRHVHKDVIATFDYTFAGEDVTIRARVENNHPLEPLAVTGFQGLGFYFSRPPTGSMPVWHYTYLQQAKLRAFHPSQLNQIGGRYAVDDEAGVGLSPFNPGLSRTLFLWDYSNWAEGHRDDPPRLLKYFVPEPIPAGGARTFAMKMRVSGNRDWKHLLEPYKEHFTAAFGTVRYKPDYRLIAAVHANRDAAAISRGNPYGFHDRYRRLDRPESAKEFCDLLIPALRQANGQGVLIWGQGGEDPRGAMYRPDFDILPPEVEANWPILQKSFVAAGLRLGVCTRPGEVAYRLNWKYDSTLPINVDDPAHLEMVWKRFKTMIDRGVTMFYLDSFGSEYEHVKAMRYFRERMGPHIQTFAEHQCDALMVFSGAYTETDYWEKGSSPWVTQSGYYPRTWLENQQVYRWLVPEIQIISRLLDVHGRMPAAVETPETFFYRNHMTPLIAGAALYPSIIRTREFRALQSQYLDDKGQWKDQAKLPSAGRSSGSAGLPGSGAALSNVGIP